MLKTADFISTGTTASSILLTGDARAIAKNKARQAAARSKELEKAKISNIDIFAEPRKDYELDLVGEVRKLLIASGQGPNIQNFDNYQLIKDAAPISPVGQMFLLNRYWRLQLIGVDTESSLDARSHLIDDIPNEDWLRLFHEGVLPFILKHCLPRQM